ncbi:MAG: MATE family efflux transporter [Lachnospiraceae bacterium]|nr:MATE family efflux transporter [Lachnospiraceae bacterium]
MTVGNPLGLLLRFAIPLIIGNLFQQVYNLADAIIVGRYVSQRALGAVGATGSITFLIISLVIGMSIGIGIIVSQYFGAGQEELVKKTIGNAVYIVGSSAIIMSVIGFTAAKPILTLLNTPKVQMADAVIYLRTTACGIIAVAGFNLVSSILRALGDSVSPIIFLTLSGVINILLDLLFVMKFGLGVMGVGVATAIAQFVSAICCLTFAYRTNSYFRLKRGHFKAESFLIKKAARVGLPVGGQNALIAFSLVVLQRVVNDFGADFVTSFTVVSRIEQIIQQPFMSIGAALATYTGQNIGAGNYDRVKKGFFTATGINTVIALVVMTVFQIFAPNIVRIFGDDPHVIELAVTGLRVTSVFYIFLGLIYTTRNILNGAGDAGFSLVTGIIEVVGRCGFAKPLTMIPVIGLNGVWLTTGITWFLNGVLSLIRVQSGKWKNKAVTRNKE